MKQILLSLVLFVATSSLAQAQTVYSRYDVNHDGKVDVLDIPLLVNAVLGKINFPVEKVVLSQESVSTFVNEPFTLTATIAPEDVDIPDLVWSSSDETVAKVSQTGVVTPLKWGNAVITATAADGCGASASCKVEVNVRPEAVDLGLSVKWSSINVGAPNPFQSGGFYEWAGTEAKVEFSYVDGVYESTVNTSATGSNLGVSQCDTYTDSSLGAGYKRIPLSHDAANLKYGEEWRIPTYGEWAELRSKCTWIWKTVAGAPGYEVVGPNGKSIFLPAVGYYFGTTHSYDKTGALYLSSTLCTDTDYTYALFFSAKTMYFASIDRSLGFPIRPVCP